MNGSGNINDRNDSHNVVQPTQLNTNVVHVKTKDTILGRERSNIVNATIQANQNIDEKQAQRINNKYQVAEEKTQMQKFLIGVGAVMAVLVGLILIFKLIKFVGDSTVAPEDKTTTVETTTALSPYQRAVGYANSTGKIRRYSSSNQVLFLLQYGKFTGDSNSGVFILANISQDNVAINKGTYNIVTNTIQLKENNTVFRYNVVDDGLSSGNAILNIDDNEYKIYANDKEMLIVNGTMDHNFGVYINESVDNSKTIYGNSVETRDYIKVGTATFNKTDEGNVRYGNSLLSYK